MAKIKLKNIITSLKNRFSHSDEGQKINEEYEKERQGARHLKVNRRPNENANDRNNRDVSAI